MCLHIARPSNCLVYAQKNSTRSGKRMEGVRPLVIHKFLLVLLYNRSLFLFFLFFSFFEGITNIIDLNPTSTFSFLCIIFFKKKWYLIFFYIYYRIPTDGYTGGTTYVKESEKGSWSKRKAMTNKRA